MIDDKHDNSCIIFTTIKERVLAYNDKYEQPYPLYQILGFIVACSYPDNIDEEILTEDYYQKCLVRIYSAMDSFKNAAKDDLKGNLK